MAFTWEYSLRREFEYEGGAAIGTARGAIERPDYLGLASLLRQACKVSEGV